MRGSYLEAGERGYVPQTDWYVVVWISLEWALELEQTYSIHFEELSFDVIPNLTGFISIHYVHYFYLQCRHFFLNR